MEFKRAVRESVGLLVGIAGPTGSGKTFSAMRLAAGIAGDKPFAVIDTEAKRAKHYADQFVFDHADLGPPFRPGAYAEAIHLADKAGYPVIVVDSMSHEHAGDGGLLDWHEEELDRLAGDDWGKRERVKMTAWIKPKSEHKRMVSKLLQVRAHLILCFRAEQKTDIVKEWDAEQRKNVTRIVPKKTLSGFEDWIPVSEKNLPFELTASFVVLPDRPGFPRPIKLQEQHRALFPLDKPIDENAGRRIAEWAAGGERGRTAKEAAARVEDPPEQGFAPEPGGQLPELSIGLKKQIENRISRLIPAAQEMAGEQLTALAHELLIAGSKHGEIITAIRDWKLPS